MIIPAHVPRIGVPAAASARSGSARPSRSIPSVITVDSPPGSTSASSPSRSAGTRTSRALAPEARENALVRLEAALKREHANDWRPRLEWRGTHTPRGESSCSDSSFEVSMLSIAAPRPVDASATRAASA